MDGDEGEQSDEDEQVARNADHHYDGNSAVDAEHPADGLHDDEITSSQIEVSLLHYSVQFSLI